MLKRRVRSGRILVALWVVWAATCTWGPWLVGSFSEGAGETGGSEKEETVIVIDPGHGGEDEGARGPAGTLEKAVTLEAARVLATVLQERLGLKAILTRTADYALPLEKRAALGNTSRGALFLSLHAGGAYSPQTLASRVFSLKPLLDLPADAGSPWTEDARRRRWDTLQSPFVLTSRRLAEALQASLNALFPSGQGREAKGAPLAVLMGARMPAALVELGCLVNPEEEKRLASPDYLKELAEALAGGIQAYRAETAGSIGSSGRAEVEEKG